MFNKNFIISFIIFNLAFIMIMVLRLTPDKSYISSSTSSNTIGDFKVVDKYVAGENNVVTEALSKLEGKGDCVVVLEYNGKRVGVQDVNLYNTFNIGDVFTAQYSETTKDGINIDKLKILNIISME